MGYSVINFNYRHAKYTPQDHKCNGTSSSSSSVIPAVATANENFDNTVQFPFLFEAAIAIVVLYSNQSRCGREYV
jgi:hypothetical protein